MRLVPLVLSLIVAAPALAEVPRVVTDTPVTGSLTQMVLGDLGTAEMLLSQNADPHHFQLRPSQARALSRAGLVIWTGPELSPWLARALEGVGMSGDELVLLAVEGTHLRMFGTGDETEHQHDADGGHGHDHTGVDPHAWLDPDNAVLWVRAIAGALSRRDPDNALIYGRNAEAAAARIDAAADRVRMLLAGAEDRPLVFFHDAYGYFTASFGLTQLGTVAKGDAVSPGAGRLAELRRALDAAEAPCLFPEAQHDPAYISALARETGARVGLPLDPNGSSLPAGPELYEAVLIGLAGAIAACAAGR